MTDPYVPSNLDDLREVVLDEVLVEGHHVDFKALLGSGPKVNKELAKDLACFAVDGGRLYIGVRERKQGEPPEVPLVELDGLRERVDQVARSVPQPPLAVRCLELRDDGDPARGVLVVEVPPSADAPHMVDGRYPARADTTSYWMADAEVRDIIARRALVAAGIEQLLDAEIDRDPTPPELRQFGHLFVVAQPVAGRPEMLHEKIDANGFSHWFSSVQFARENVRWDPDVNGLPHRDRRAGGWAAHSYEISPDRQVRPNGDRPAQERNLLDIEVHEDGGIRLFCGRATDETRNSGQVVIIDALVAGLVGRVVSLARAVADTTAYHGTWHLAVAATNLRGASASSRARSFAFDDGTPYSADEYRKTYSPSYAELEEPAILLGRLVAPLLRSISSPLDINDVV